MCSLHSLLMTQRNTLFILSNVHMYSWIYYKNIDMKKTLKIFWSLKFGLYGVNLTVCLLLSEKSKYMYWNEHILPVLCLLKKWAESLIGQSIDISITHSAPLHCVEDLVKKCRTGLIQSFWGFPLVLNWCKEKIIPRASSVLNWCLEKTLHELALFCQHACAYSPFTNFKQHIGV